ncbi:hypothetical protein [Shewanella donghaensis]|uniref:hypothetical protein n=1 Tax=Shewanella donghaensis TaxID=238836 RepID=UPI0011824EF4|nr:hypothetical protein [Shewanella donghaensis]
MDKALYIVLGMHRSGTSLISAGINSLGLDFGNKLMGESESNQKGHWEDTDIVGLNNKLFKLLNVNWDYLGLLPEQWHHQPEIINLRNEALLLIEHKLNNAKSDLCIKDPRIIRLFPFWSDVFEILGIKPNYIFVYRSPIDVMKSLLKRDKKPLIEGQLLWLHHNLDYFSELAKHKVVFIEFNEFVADSKSQLVRIAKYFSISYVESQLESFAHDFLDKSLINSQTNSYNLSVDGNVLSFSHDIFRKLNLITSPNHLSDIGVFALQAQWLASSDMACQIHRLGLNNEKKLKEKIQKLAATVSSEVLDPKRTDSVQVDTVKIIEEHTADISLELNVFKSEFNSMLNQQQYLYNVYSEQLDANLNELSVRAGANGNSIDLMSGQMKSIEKTATTRLQQVSKSISQVLEISSELRQQQQTKNILINEKLDLEKILRTKETQIGTLTNKNKKIQKQNSHLIDNIARFKQEREHIRKSYFWKIGQFFKIVK